jgi:hypothetical protein
MEGADVGVFLSLNNKIIYPLVENFFGISETKNSSQFDLTTSH